MFQVTDRLDVATWKDYCYDLSDSDVYKDVESDDYILKEWRRSRRNRLCY